jgi:Tfp pilus assembly protein PilN
VADINLLPHDYGMQGRVKRRRKCCLVIFFVLLVLLCTWFLGLVGKIQSYRRELDDLQQQLASQEPDLLILDELEQKDELIKQRRQLCNQLEQGGLSWPVLMREIEEAARQGILLEQLHIDREGKVMVQGQAAELASIASFLSFLAASSDLDKIDIDYVKLGKEGEWLFALQGWAHQVGEGL